MVSRSRADGRDEPVSGLCQRDTLQTLRLRAHRSRQASTAPATKIIVMGSCRDYSRADSPDNSKRDEPDKDKPPPRRPGGQDNH